MLKTSATPKVTEFAYDCIEVGNNEICKLKTNTQVMHDEKKPQKTNSILAP